MITTSTKTEILSLAAYIPWSLLPEYIQDYVKDQAMLPTNNCSDENTEVYVCKESFDCSDELGCKYTVTVRVLDAYDNDGTKWEDIVEIADSDLTPEEKDVIDFRIQERIIQSLRKMH